MHIKKELVLKQYMLILLIFGSAVLGACSSSHSQYQNTVFVESADPMQDLEFAINRAKAADKRLLLVMGAQWCHDSRGLAENFSRPQLADILAEHYEVLFVDVGYYKDLRAITQRFGQANYFATPTVYVIDPQTEKLLNTTDYSIWGSADSLPFDTYTEYFRRYAYADTNSLLAKRDNMSASNILLIEDFKYTQSERLQYAYGILVPDMLREDLKGESSEAFFRRWEEVKQFRGSLQKDIDTLYEQAQNAPNETVVTPAYPAFSWEHNIQ
jgi:thioredoxin-related protein